MKKYYITLEADYTGTLIVEAKDRKEAEEKGEEILNKTAPRWFDVAAEGVPKIKLFNKKYHKCEYSMGTGTCICGKKLTYK